MQYQQICNNIIKVKKNLEWTAKLELELNVCDVVMC